jgi:hypothetical protein
MKPQLYRIFDVVLLAPAMFAAGHVARANGRPLLGAFMQAAAFGTALYNGGNYVVRDAYLGRR